MSFADAVRRPEYTGENRCRPCTVVNVAVVAVVGVALAVVSVPLAVGVVGVGLTAVAVRGYVVPYTPEFAPYIAAQVPISFEHGSKADGTDRVDPHTSLADAGRNEADAGRNEADANRDETTETATAGNGPSERVASGAPDGEEVTAALLEAGVLVGGDRLQLASTFESTWLAAIRDLRAADDEALAARVADAAGFTDEATVVGQGVRVGGPAGTTLARPAAITDTATIEALSDAGVPARFWQPATRPVRLFLPECPLCGGTLTETTHAECCGGAGSVYGSLADEVLACADCEAVVHRFAADEL